MAKSFHELSPRAQIDRLRAPVRARRWPAPGRCSIGPRARRARDAPRALAKLEGEVARAQAIADKLPAAAARSARARSGAARDDGRRSPKRRIRRTSCATCTSWRASRRSTSRASSRSRSSPRRSTPEWPIQLGLEGGYHDLGRFFDRIAAMSRLISVSRSQHQDARPKPNGRGTVTATCVATTFVFQKDAGADRRRRRARKAGHDRRLERPSQRVALLARCRRSAARPAQIPGRHQGRRAAPSAGGYDERRPPRPVRQPDRRQAPRRPTPSRAARPATGLASFAAGRRHRHAASSRRADDRMAILEGADKQSYVAKVQRPHAGRGRSRASTRRAWCSSS